MMTASTLLRPHAVVKARIDISCAALLVLTAAAGTIRADDPAPPSGKDSTQESEREALWRDLQISPKKISEPLLDVRIFPDASLRRSENAATHYLRFAWENRRVWGQLEEAPRMLALPAGEFSPAAARSAVSFVELRLDNLRRAANSAHVDWAYPIYDGRPLANVLLPDNGGPSRDVVRGVALLCRADIFDGKTADALDKLRIGFGLVHHLQQPPFLVVKLLHVYTAHTMLDRCEELVARPDAPNLYWALAALPAPLVDFRPAVDFERRILVSVVPDLGDLDRPRTRTEWQAVLDRLAEVVAAIYNDPNLKQRLLSQEYIERARRELAAREPSPGEERDAAHKPQSDEEIVVRYFAARYVSARDRGLRTLLLPPSQALPILRREAKTLARRKEEAPELDKTVVTINLHSYSTAWSVQRRIDVLRIVEALRDHAARHEGRFPAALDELELPVPLDVMRGKPFEYRREMGTAYLSAPAPPELAKFQKRHSLHYRIRVR